MVGDLQTGRPELSGMALTPGSAQKCLAPSSPSGNHTPLHILVWAGDRGCECTAPLEVHSTRIHDVISPSGASYPMFSPRSQYT